MMLLHAWHELLKKMYSRDFIRQWRSTVALVNSLWWQKGRWFILAVVFVCIFQFDALFLGVSDTLFDLLQWVGAVGWTVSLFSLYCALSQVLFGQRSVSFFKYGLFFALFLCVRIVLTIGGGLLEEVLLKQGILGTIIYAMLAPCGLTDIFVLTQSPLTVSKSGRLDIDCAAWFVFFMVCLLSHADFVKNIGHSILSAFKAVVKSYPVALIFYFVAVLLLGLVDRAIELVSMLVALPMQSPWMPGLVAIPVVTLIRWVVYFPWSLIALPWTLSFIGLLYKKVDATHQ